MCGQSLNSLTKNGLVTPSITAGMGRLLHSWVNSLNSLSCMVKYGRASAQYSSGAINATKACTICEQSAGEVPTTTIGSDVMTSSHSVYKWSMT